MAPLVFGRVVAEILNGTPEEPRRSMSRDAGGSSRSESTTPSRTIPERPVLQLTRDQQLYRGAYGIARFERHRSESDGVCGIDLRPHCALVVGQQATRVPLNYLFIASAREARKTIPTEALRPEFAIANVSIHRLADRAN